MNDELQYEGEGQSIDGVEPGVTGKTLTIRNLADGEANQDQGKVQVTIANNNGERESIVVHEGNLRMLLANVDDQEAGPATSPPPSAS